MVLSLPSAVPTHPQSSLPPLDSPLDATIDSPLDAPLDPPIDSILDATLDSPRDPILSSQSHAPPSRPPLRTPYSVICTPNSVLCFPYPLGSSLSSTHPISTRCPSSFAKCRIRLKPLLPDDTETRWGRATFWPSRRQIAGLG